MSEYAVTLPTAVKEQQGQINELKLTIEQLKGN